ncbi:MAG: hypothetical protein M1820_004862 [Bogoriella megaspora]|nr:MAG: hypothetical protein M1820_004862 [Bogoriella megaspora]
MALAAIRHHPTSQFLSAFLPVAFATLRPAATAPIVQPWRRLPLLETAAALPIAIGSGISSTLRDIWDSVLRAVPKKKTTHSKKRHRQMAGKALKDTTALTIRQYWGTNWKPTPELEKEQKAKKDAREAEEKSRQHAKDMQWK